MQPLISGIFSLFSRSLFLAIALAAPTVFAAEVESVDSMRVPARVVLLHGLGRGAYSMRPLAKTLRVAGYDVSNLEYDSRGRGPAELIADLSRKVAEYCGEKQAPLHFVTHSLGGILVRGYLAEGRPVNLARVVLLAPPNQGSELVDAVGDVAAFEALLGPTAVELGTNSDSLPNRLGPADYEVGVIAGRQSINPIGPS